MYGVIGTDGVVYGPVTVATLIQWVAAGRVVPTTTLIDGNGRHLTASMVPELYGALFPMGAPAPGPGPAFSYAPPAKRKRTALALAFFLGAFGAHRFYLGHTATGVAMLALNVATLALATSLETMIVLGAAATLWLIVDMAMIGNGVLREANGRPLE